MQAFDVFIVKRFFAQFRLVVKTLKVNKARKVCKLDETGFIPERDLTCCRQRRVVFAKCFRRFAPRPALGYSNSIFYCFHIC